MGVLTNLNPRAVLQHLTKDPDDSVIEKNRRNRWNLALLTGASERVNLVKADFIGRNEVEGSNVFPKPLGDCLLRTIHV